MVIRGLAGQQASLIAYSIIKHSRLATISIPVIHCAALYITRACRSALCWRCQVTTSGGILDAQLLEE
jgi:hypothetical protein